MEAVKSLKRSLPTYPDLCITCQEMRHEPLFRAALQGLKTIKDATQERRKNRDIQYKDAIEGFQRFSNGVQNDLLCGTSTAMPITQVNINKQSEEICT